MTSDDRIDSVLSSATELANRDEFSAALRLLEPLAVSEANDPRVLGVLAGIHLRQDRFEEAALLFRRVTELSPRSERASLGLSHALWKAGEHSLAERELSRFLGVRHSEDYQTLLEELGWRFEDGVLLKSP